MKPIDPQTTKDKTDAIDEVMSFCTHYLGQKVTRTVAEYIFLKGARWGGFQFTPENTKSLTGLVTFPDGANAEPGGLTRVE